MKAELSYLDLINLCDNAHPPVNGGIPPDATGFDAEKLVPLYLTPSLDSAIIGILRPVIVEQLKAENARSNELGLRPLWDIRVEESTYRLLRNGRVGPSVSFSAWCDKPSKRTEAMREVCERWRDTGLFADVCGPTKWRGELYPVYKEPFGVHDHASSVMEGGDESRLNYAFEMERSACALFGVVTYGVHMSIYEEREDEQGNRSLNVWVPTRSRTKQTFPGMLDNTVAGGIPSGMGNFESMVKECMEEASLDAGIVRKYARAVGAISYFFREQMRTSKGWLQPEIEYVYNIAILPEVDPSVFTPRPLDGEVESFEVWGLAGWSFMKQDKVIEELRAGKFKPNCGLVLIDLFIRLGLITAENEAEYMELCTRLHGRFSYEIW
ncbi:nudix hydrolase 20 [Macrolepiota fuliginosa MF-IS2]|uniref:Nudix hydrolase 20 n=1 Tax=Macrolepiota fuliginosa MF-IS2 TaxID=1400762 RepID=A0A9P5XPI5_9AGAR|nr:nudix hydrolase 20 [Macrolepiota fuliginosa MF-IS2]